MTCHEYEAVLWSFDNTPHKKSHFQNRKKQKSKEKLCRSKTDIGPSLFTLGLDVIDTGFGLSNATPLTPGLHVSTTAEPHRTIMRGVEDGARGGWGGGVSEELQ